MTEKELAALFEELELRMIASLKRNLPGHKAWEKDLGFDWSAWQAEKIKALERFRKENEAILREYRDTISKETRKLLEEQFAEEQAREADELGEVTDDSFFELFDEKLESLIDEMHGKETTVEKAALRMMDDVYRQTIQRADMALQTGSVTVPKAIELAVEDFARQGINCIEYRDGRRVNIADYVQMALRTSNTRAALLGGAKQRMALGIDIVRVSSYGGCSETCQPWQGGIYIDDVFAVFEGEIVGDRGKSRNGKWYLLLSVAVKAGLFHPNCRHTLTGCRDDAKPTTPLDGEKIRQNYKLEQKQRALERNIRKWKRLEVAVSDPVVQNAYGKKVRSAQADLRAFIAEHKDVLRRDNWREKTYGTPNTGNKASSRNNMPNEVQEQEKAFKNRLKAMPKDDIINQGSDSLLEIAIDKFTPCLEDAQTGEIIETTYSLVTESELKQLMGWNFNWLSEDLNEAEIFKLQRKDNADIQGLIALTKFERDKAIYVNLAESAPHNLGKDKKYNGVGGHLFAIAAQRSKQLGYGGFVFMDAKNTELVNHYRDSLGAVLLGMPHPYRMFIDEDAAERLLRIYTLEQGGN